MVLAIVLLLGEVRVLERGAASTVQVGVFVGGGASSGDARAV